jgi:hypothetical protein
MRRDLDLPEESKLNSPSRRKSPDLAPLEESQLNSLSKRKSSSSPAAMTVVKTTKKAK